MSTVKLTRRGKLAAVFGATAAIYATLAVIAPVPEPEPGTGPWRHCIEVQVLPPTDTFLGTTRLDCYLTGDVPEGARIVWSGYESNIPRP